MADGWTKGGTIFAGIGLIIGFAGVAASVTVPELRRCIRLDPGGCPFLGAPASEPPKMESEVGLDYSGLRDFLGEQNFRKANEETGKMLLLSVDRADAGFLTDDSIPKIPCKDIVTIDKLWMWSSADKLGFSPQREIWKEVKESWSRFEVRTEWGNPDLGLENFRKGALPTIPIQSNGKVISSLDFYLFDRLDSCKREG